MALTTVKRIVLALLRRMGFEVRRIGKAHTRHEAVRPFATLSPWNEDRQFMGVYDAIIDHTLVDKYRSYELWTLARDMRDVPGAIIEIGVWRGGTGAILASASAGYGATTYLCDTFRGVVKVGQRDSAYRGGEHADTSRQIVEGLVSRLNLMNARILEGVFPDQTGHLVAAERFRLAHIDVDVYQSAKDAFEFVWPRLSIGGVVVFDDYGFEGFDGICTLVEEIRGKSDRRVIHNLNGHAIVVKVGELSN